MGQNNKTPRAIELLSPAANPEVARQAILHGADAVYIGGPAFGARKAASNSIESIAGLCAWAHDFRARVYVTVNTIVYDKELAEVERLCRQLYRSGVDALIIQDMGLMQLDLPPIALHASTQCDTRTIRKAKFLEDVGMSQIVLARELGLDQIKRICDEVTVPVECFVHGALCVSYSGRCHASQYFRNRSANRGECAQICRLPYDLVDSRGKVIVSNKHLLSLKDLNLSDSLEDLLEAGVSSFKIEGRLKDAAYVKNVTAYYRNCLDRIIEENPEKYRRSSFGQSVVTFEPKLEKSFNRGFTHYFLKKSGNNDMASIHTPKSMGETISDVSQLHNGDGVAFFNKAGEYEGVKINRVDGGRLITYGASRIPKNAILHRTSDRQWEKMMERPTAHRRINVDMDVDRKGITACDERGVKCRIAWELDNQKAQKPQTPAKELSRLGTTIYTLRGFKNNLPQNLFIPNSILGKARKEIVKLLDAANAATYRYDKRRKENTEICYVTGQLDYRENVANDKSVEFYMNHGAKTNERALECIGKSPSSASAEPDILMTTRYCVLRQLGMCKKHNNPTAYHPPLYLRSGDICMKLECDCGKCENILKTPAHKKC